MAIRTGLDDAEQNSEFADFLPEPSDTEEQRQQKADKATIRDAVRYRYLGEEYYEERLKHMILRDDGTLICKYNITDKTVIRDSDPTLDTTFKERIGKCIALRIALAINFQKCCVPE